MKKRILIILFSAFIFSSAPGFAATLHVPSEYGTIISAVSAAGNGDTVLVADGTYTGSGSPAVTFSGKPITIMSENGPDNCIVDCNLSSLEGLQIISGETATSILDGFTIKRGYKPNDSGGGIYITNSSPTIRNCIITGCTAQKGGAIACLSTSSPHFIDCIIQNNTAELGGGVHVRDAASPVFQNCSILNNEATGALSDSNGGGFHVSNAGEPELDGCLISGNTARENGGGVYCFESTPYIFNCTFLDNTASTINGGAIELYSSPLDDPIYNCTFDGNTCDKFGGAIDFYLSSGNVINCIFTNNNASNGGAISSRTGSTNNFTNCLISGNTTTSSGAGIYTRDGALGVSSCTMSGNSTVSGGGIRTRDSTVTILNSILWGDSPSEIVTSGTAPGATYSDIQQTSGVYPGTGNINQNPLFVPGPLSNYYLQRDSKAISPCIDTGSAMADAICFTAGSIICMNTLTTEKYQSLDSGMVDMGMHYEYVPNEDCSDPFEAACDSIDPLEGDLTGNFNSYDCASYGCGGNYSGGDEVWHLDIGSYARQVTITLDDSLDNTMDLIVTDSCPPGGGNLVIADNTAIIPCAAGELYIFVDMPGSSAGAQYSLDIVCDICPGENCEVAEEFVCGTCRNGNTIGLDDDHGDCGGGNHAGPDKVYFFTVSESRVVTVRAEADFDADYAVATVCDDGTHGTELICTDSLGTNPDISCSSVISPHALGNFTYSWLASPGTYYFWIDGKNAVSEGNFALEITCTEPTPTPLPSETPTPMPSSTPTELPTSTPTGNPSPTPSGGILNAFVTLERYGVMPPADSWSVPLTVDLIQETTTVDSFTVNTNLYGEFSVDVEAGTYSIWVKNHHTLANKITGITVPLGGSTGWIDLGTLREGDANNDNYVVASDFFVLRAAYNSGEGDPNWNANADFNEDHYVTTPDFFLLRNHYNQSGATH